MNLCKAICAAGVIFSTVICVCKGQLKLYLIVLLTVICVCRGQQQEGSTASVTELLIAKDIVNNGVITCVLGLNISNTQGAAYFAWYYNGAQLEENLSPLNSDRNNPHHTYFVNSSLTVLNSDKQINNGLYRCVVEPILIGIPGSLKYFTDAYLDAKNCSGIIDNKLNGAIKAATITPSGPITVIKNEPLTLTCNITINSTRTCVDQTLEDDRVFSLLSVKWYRNDKQLIDTNKYNVSYSWLNDGEVEYLVSYLQVASVDVSDGGRYRCTIVMDNDGGIIESTGVNVCIESKANNQQSLNSSHIELTLGSILAASAVCGGHALELMPAQDGNCTERENRNSITELRSFDVANQMENEYICCSCLMLEEKITVTVKDTFIQNVIINNVTESTNALLTCSVTLNTAIGPDTSLLLVTWSHNGSNIISGSKYSVSMISNGIVSDQFSSTLTISSTNFTDGGVYTCTATIQGRTITANGTICAIAGSIDPALYTNLILGSELNSSVCGRNVANIVTYTLAQPSMVLSSSLNSSLVICNIEVHHNLPHECAVSQSIPIIIRIRDTYIQTISMNISDYTYIDESADAIITCTVTLNTIIGPDTSSLHINFFRDNTYIPTEEEVNGNSNKFSYTLMIKNAGVDDGGIYECRAYIEGNNVATRKAARNICIRLGSIDKMHYTNLVLGSTLNSSVCGINSTDVMYMLSQPHPAFILNQNEQYTCVVNVANNPNDCSSQEQNITLLIQETFIETVTINSEEFFIKPNNALLTCSITLNTTIGPDTSSLLVTWSHNGNPIDTTAAKYTVSMISNGAAISDQFSSTLTISSTDFTDGGVYTCTATIQGRTMAANGTVCVIEGSIDPALYTNLILGSELNSSVCGRNVSNIVTYTLIQPHPPVVITPINNTIVSCTAKVQHNPSQCPVSQTIAIHIRIRETHINYVAITPEQDSLSVELGANLTLYCSPSLNTDIVVSAGILNIQWKDSSGTILNNGSHYPTLPLMINGFRSSQAGTYTCSSWLENNINDMKQDEIKLTYEVPTSEDLSINVLPISKSVYSVNNTLQLNCTAILDTTFINTQYEAHFKWKRQQRINDDNAVISPGVVNFVMSSNIKKYSSSITFNNLGLSDAGNYTCSLQYRDTLNDLLSSRKETTFAILIKAFQPQISITFSDTNYFIVGDDATIRCNVPFNLFIFPVCTILRNNTVIIDEGGNRGSINNRPVTLKSVSISDSGVYSCKCYYKGSTDYPNIVPSNNNIVSRYLSVIDVRVRVDVNRLVVLLDSRYNTLSIDCVTQYQPKDDLEPNEYNISTDTGSIHTVNGSQAIISFSSSGYHQVTCNITLNIIPAADTITHPYTNTTSVYVKGPSLPYPATDIRVTVLNSTAAIVYWTIHNISYTPEYYTVLYTISNTSGEQSSYSSYAVYTSTVLEEFLQLNSARYNIILDGLTSYTTYQINVNSTNSEGSIMSQEQAFFTTKEKVPGGVANISVSVVNSSTLVHESDSIMKYIVSDSTNVYSEGANNAVKPSSSIPNSSGFTSSTPAAVMNNTSYTVKQSSVPDSAGLSESILAISTTVPIILLIVSIAVLISAIVFFWIARNKLNKTKELTGTQKQDISVSDNQAYSLNTTTLESDQNTKKEEALYEVMNDTKGDESVSPYYEQMF